MAKCSQCGYLIHLVQHEIADGIKKAKTLKEAKEFMEAILFYNVDYLREPAEEEEDANR